MKSRVLPAYVYVFLVLLAALACIGLYQRNQVEQRNRSVCLVAEHSVIANLAAVSQIPYGQALDQLRTEGLRGIVLTEQTVGDWISEGRVQTVTTGDPRANADKKINPNRQWLQISGSQQDIQAVSQAIAVHFPGIQSIGSYDGQSITLPLADVSLLRTLSLGISQRNAKIAIDHNLIVIARLSNPMGITDQEIDNTISLCRQRGATVFLPEGEQVLGRRKGIKTLVEALRREGMLYASPEFAKIGGNPNAVEDAPDITVLLHSAQIAELDKDTFPAAVERYTKAARERDMRILLLRPVDLGSQNPLRDFGTFLQAVAQGLAKQGQTVGIPHPYSAPSTPRIFYPILGLCLVPIVWGLCSEFVAVLTLPLSTLTLLASLLAFSPHERNPIAFLIAVTVPCVTFASMEPLAKKSVIAGYFGSCILSLIGGFAIGAMLSQLPYFVNAQEFQGVKLAVFLPIILAGWYFLDRFGHLKKLSYDPITLRAAVFGIILIGILGYMFIRTGNDNPASVSPLELKMRAVLDHLLFVRPRTKSFLIGLPALLIAIQLLRKYLKSPEGHSAVYGGWMALALAAAMISQTDIVNTFCHIHTPVLLSIERIGVELVIGGIVGIIFWQIIDYFIRKNENRKSGEPVIATDAPSEPANVS